MNAIAPKTVVKVQRKNAALCLGIERAKEAKTVIIRTWTTGAKPTYRMQDEQFNPLVTLSNSDFTFLTQNGILRPQGENKFQFNNAINLETV